MAVLRVSWTGIRVIFGVLRKREEEQKRSRKEVPEGVLKGF